LAALETCLDVIKYHGDSAPTAIKNAKTAINNAKNIQP